ncbi:MAG: uracil phosphoribosyltransferase [Candidatus Puniceispirillum sp.]|nr:uracil phosphoribosyltransferase [Candidatus Puniceispirillum sp.]MCA0369579.1 uracil phosphoribosyltransferase [Pseudomonadota bacterium]
MEHTHLHVLDHPLIQHKLSCMRDVNTDKPTFRRLLKEIALLMGYEITRHLPVFETRITTPMTSMLATKTHEDRLVVVPILRAGIGMAEGLMDLFPLALEGHIGLFRDPETKRPVEYLVKLPPVEDKTFILVDPMLATGHSAAYAVSLLRARGVPASSILFLSLVAAPEGLEVFFNAHPEVALYTAAQDLHLNAHAYIIPGLGDAGDRLFGTI